MSRPTLSAELRRAFQSQSELIAAALAPAVANKAVQARFVLAALHLQAASVQTILGQTERARLHEDAFVRQCDLLTDVCAEISPALLSAFAGRARLRSFLGARAGKVMASRLGLEDLKVATDSMMADIPIRAPTPAGFADMYAALGLRRPEGRPLGASALGETLEEVEGKIRKALEGLHRERMRPTREKIAEQIGVSVRTLRREIELWRIDLAALRGEARDRKAQRLRGKRPT